MFTRSWLNIMRPSKFLIVPKTLRLENRFFLPFLCKNNIQIFRCINNTSSKNLGKLYGAYTQIEGSRDNLTPINFSKSSPPELLEKLIAGLSNDIHKKNRVYKNDLSRVIAKVKELNFSTTKQGLLLIKCCTELLPDETVSSRLTLLEQVWNSIKPHTNFVVDHYNELLRVYIANNRTINVHSFIQQMAPVKPNITTYELILKVLAQVGDSNQASEVITNMKSQNLPATEDIFNSLIICEGKTGNFKNMQEVLTTMTSLKLGRSVDTVTSIAKVWAWNKNPDKLMLELEKARKTGLYFDETHIMEIVKVLAEVGLYPSISQVLKYLPVETLKTPSISAYMQSVATLLVYQNHPLAALEMYKCLPLPSFGPKDDQGLHGRSLIRDCVKAAVPSSIIAMIVQVLMSSGRNPIAIQNAAEAALQFGRVPLALDLFTRMKQLGMPVRPHYFWPILINSSKTYGEKGIMNTLTTMVTMDITPDYETILNYALPYVSFTSPQNLMKKFLDTGLTASMVLTPMMETLLNMGQVRAASEICELFHGKIDVEKILKPLVRGYLTALDVQSTLHILEDVTQKALDKNKDWVGRFLCIFMQHKKVKEDVSDLFSIVEALKKTNLRISPSATDYCIARLSDNLGDDKLKKFKQSLTEIADERLMDEVDLFSHQIPHPKQMNEESLRAHLIELEAKGMNTRGVMRRLLQQYCREGNLVAARAMLDKCTREGVFMSAGMKASIFDLYVKSGDIDEAELALADLNKTAPNFTLDEFKIIDFATLMVYKKKINKAFDLLNEQSKKSRVIGGRNISMNCWRLLDGLASEGKPDDVKRMFNLLTSLRYCKPSNVLLGPVIRVHMKRGDIQEAVKEFVHVANKYGKTPLKHELLCKIVQDMGEGRSEDNFLVNVKADGTLSKMARTILDVDKKIHGAGDVQMTLIAVFADVGYKKSLRKLFLDPTIKFHPDALMRRCERFAEEKKVNALEVIAECAKGLRHIDVDEVYDLILDVYQIENKWRDAISLWNRMQDADMTPSQKFVQNICSLIKSNNQDIPSDLTILLDKQAKKSSN